MQLNRIPRKRRQTGVSMIELLVAFVIFSFGMLGLAGLQSRTLAYNQSSLFRSQATALADDILDRMRVDRDNALALRWNTELASTSSTITPLTFIYQTDLKDWKGQIEALLPDGKGRITVAADRSVTIEIEWLDNRTADSPRQSFTTVSRL
ncbi:type IV pilus modification protein PilV [Rhizobacter sp. P5_C2]